MKRKFIAVITAEQPFDDEMTEMYEEASEEYRAKTLELMRQEFSRISAQMVDEDGTVSVNVRVEEVTE